MILNQLSYCAVALTWGILLLTSGLSREAASIAAVLEEVAVGEQDTNEGRWEVGEPVAAIGLLTSSQTLRP